VRGNDGTGFLVSGIFPEKAPRVSSSLSVYGEGIEGEVGLFALSSSPLLKGELKGLFVVLNHPLPFVKGDDSKP
jgi:hypothetical protein